MKTLLNTAWMFFFLTLLSCTPDRKKARMEILRTEKEFEKMAAEKGVAEAFSFYIADSGVVSARDHLFKGKNEVKRHYEGWPYKEVSLKWSPDYIDVSKSCDLGYTYGRYTFSYRDSTGAVILNKGIFHTVWKKQPDGSWRFVWD